MRAGLAASTVTPGITAPDASLTTPVNVLCACAIDGSASSANASTANLTVRMYSRAIAIVLSLLAGSQDPTSLDCQPDDQRRGVTRYEGRCANEMRTCSEYDMRAKGVSRGRRPAPTKKFDKPIGI